MKDLKDLKAKITNHEQMVKFMVDEGQWAPLFNEEPDLVVFEQISGDVEKRHWAGNDYYTLIVSEEETNTVARYPIVRGKEKQDSFDIGVFLALRQHEKTNGDIIEKGAARAFAC